MASEELTGAVAQVGWLRLAHERRFVLASESPRRAALLRQLGLEFEIRPSRVREDSRDGEPEDRAQGLARQKALAVAADLGGTGAVVLGADTEVVLDGKAMGKPSSPRQAHAMLVSLRGRTHEVVTALYLVDVVTGLSRCASETTRVTMRRFSDAEAVLYAYSGDPLDKAGAYGIQGAAGALIERIEGCYFNVVGLPLSRLVRLMEDLWVALRETR